MSRMSNLCGEVVSIAARHCACRRLSSEVRSRTIMILIYGMLFFSIFNQCGCPKFGGRTKFIPIECSHDPPPSNKLVTEINNEYTQIQKNTYVY